MMTGADRTSVTREIDRLIDQQIHTLHQHAAISELELKAHRDRSQRIRSLCRNLRPEGSPNWMSESLAGDLLVKP